MKSLMVVVLIALLSGCASSGERPEPEIVGQELIDDGATYVGFHIGRNGNTWCRYDEANGTRTLVIQENGQVCAK